MLLNLLLDNIQQAYKDDIYVTALFIGIIFMIDFTLTRKHSIYKTIGGWFAVVFTLYSLTRIIYIGQSLLLNKFEALFIEHTILYNLFYGFGIWMYFVQLSLLVIGTKYLYKGKLSLHIFITSVIYLFVSIISDYLMPLLLVVINPKVGESGYYINFEIGGGMYYPIIGIGLAVILYILYRHAICKKIKVIFSMPEQRMKRLLYIPVLAYVTYSLIYLLMSYVNVYAALPERLIYFVLIFATIIIIYLTMFIAFFYGIISSIDFTKMETEIKVAAEIQKENLPNDFNDLVKDNTVDLAASMKAANDVCGDFFDYFFVSDELLAVVIADVSGKGVSASLIMMKTKVLIEESALYTNNPATILTKVNSRLEKNNRQKNFVTAFLGILNIKTGTFVYSSAGHNYPIIKNKQDKFQEVKTKNGLVLCGIKNSEYRNEEIKLERGDKVFLYTDGITEALNNKDEMFGVQRLLNVMNMPSLKKVSMEVFLWEVQSAVDKFTEQAEQWDDMTMLAFEYNGI